MQTFMSDGVEIAFVDEGTGDPILLIHGFASNIKANWRDVRWIDALINAGRRVIALDNRGHGNSAKPYEQEAYEAPKMAQDARRLLDHLNIPKADVMGYSMGARITAFLAMKNPEYVRSAIFAGMGYNMIRGVGGTGPIAAAMEAPSIDDVTNDAAKTFRLFAESTGSDLQALAHCIRASRTKIEAEDLAKIQVPVLIAVGTKDVVAGPAAKLAEIIPGSEVLDIVDRDHMRAVGDKVYKEGVLDYLRRRP